NNNTYAGDTSIGTGQATGIARVTRSNPFGTTGTVTIGSAGNATAARLEIQDGRTIPNNINFSGRASATVGIENLSGTNNFGGTISAQAGGSFYLIQSDSGLVKLTGSNNGGVALNAGATGARTFTLQGAGDGSVNGSIANGSGTVSLNKNGAGTWTLSGSNSYTGGTTVTSGTLRIAPAAVASYSFDTVSGNTVMNTGNGGTAMNGTLANGASIVSGGRFGNAVSLSGSAYVNINNPVMDMGYVGNWTVSAWVKTTTAGSTILTKGDGTTWTTGNTIFYLGDGAGGGSGGTPSAVRYAGGFFQSSGNSTSVNDGNWHMVTYVNNGGTYAIYVDGVAQSLSSGNNAFVNADVGTVVRLGMTTDPFAFDGTVNFNGLLDEVQFYDQALSSTQIATIYQGQAVTTSVPSTGSLAVNSGGTLEVNGSTPGAITLTSATGSTLTGVGAIAATTTINGTHSPGIGIGSQTLTGAVTYSATAHLSWELSGNTITSGSFDTVSARAATVNNGAKVDVALNSSGSAVDFTNAFWKYPAKWTVLTGTYVSGSFSVGNVSTDSAGHTVSSYGTFALQQSGT